MQTSIVKKKSSKFWIFKLILIFLVVQLIGTLGYMFIEEMHFSDAMFQTGITFTTVGFGEIQPLSQVGRLYTIILIFIGIGVIGYSISLFSQQLWRKDLVDYQYFSSLDELDSSKIQKTIASVLDSNSFLTALRSALPRGEKDEKYGLDYIPFMLHSINERRERFEKSSKIYLLVTVFLGIIFITIVTFFGYILVNEASIGTPKRVVTLNNRLLAKLKLKPSYLYQS